MKVTEIWVSDNPTDISPFDVDEVTDVLLANDAITIADGIEGENKFGSAPVYSAYFALCHSSLAGNLRATPGFIGKIEYPSQARVMKSEWGSIGSLRFFLSSVGSITPNASNLGNDVFNCFCMGMEAYAYIEQDQYSTQFIYLPKEFSGPMALNCSAGYKMACGQVITNDLWLINLRMTRG